MKKVDLIVYRDKIKKMHKAAIALKGAHEEYDKFENEKLLGDGFDKDEDWKKLSNFMQSNPDLSDMLIEVEEIVKGLSGL